MTTGPLPLPPVPHPLLTRHADPYIGAAMARAFAELHALEGRRHAGWAHRTQDTAVDRITASLEHVNELGPHSREALADAIAAAAALTVHAAALRDALLELAGSLP